MADTDADAKTIFNEALKSFGFTVAQIDSMFDKYLEWQTTYTNKQIMDDLLPTTDAFKARFSGNEKRIAQGFEPLTPQQYIAAEISARAVLRDAQLPEGFYDSNDDVAGFIANDISPAEIKTRADAAYSAVQNADPAYKTALRDLYGIDEGEMAAFFLDADRARPLIEKRAKAMEFGTAAARQGLKVNNIGEQFAKTGPATGFSAEQGYAQIASMLPEAQKLGSIYNQNYDQSTAEAEVFGVGEGLASAKRKRQKLGELEKDNFSGQSGISAGSLKKNNAGSF